MSRLQSNIKVVAKPGARSTTVLTADAVRFVALLHARLAERRVHLLTSTFEPAAGCPDPIAGTPGVVISRPDLHGTTKSLNCGAQIWVADFDTAEISWHDRLIGIVNLRDALDRRIELLEDEGRRYVVGTDLTAIAIRPRGLRSVEKYLLSDGHPVSASVFDVAMYLYHCAERSIEAGDAPTVYLPATTDPIEFAWWTDLVTLAEHRLGLAHGAVRTVTSSLAGSPVVELDRVRRENAEHAAWLGLAAQRYELEPAAV